ncbi:MAG: DUF4366 domain-containing protein [Lachnospiraceae bacterium]|nr:DUF4366 domain-containing protein [Lachnospiraceae bacterium]
MKSRIEKPKSINKRLAFKTIFIIAVAILLIERISLISVHADEMTSEDGTSRQVVGKLEDGDSTDIKELNPDMPEPSQKSGEDNSGNTSLETLPDIEIYIDIPDGYYNEKTTITFSLKTKDGSMPSIKSVKARAGKKGSYTDVTETMNLEITEDCTIHVIATDTSGRTYERSRKITCFDKEAPTLNASVSEGILEVVPKDSLSGVKSIIINGYEYTELKNGKLTIRLSQFDAGYEKFYIQATDNAGNKSEKYTVKNPYYKSKDSDSDYVPATELPKDTHPTDISDSTAEVTEHIKVDNDGNVITSAQDISDLLSEIGIISDDNNGDKTDKDGINISVLGDILGYLSNNEYDETLLGREFYTINTKSGKSFYLIIDKIGDRETVRFLTDITENDLLHVVKSDSQSLPRNSAAKDSAIKDSALSNNNGNADTDEGYSGTKQMTDDEVQKIENAQQAAQEEGKTQEPSFIQRNMSYIIMAVAGVIAIILGYYFKVVKRRKNQDPDDTVEESGEEQNTEDTEEDYLGITKDEEPKQ